MAKCEHGSYIPVGSSKALYCALCNPEGVPNGPSPVLPRSAADLFNADKTGKLETCPQCGNVRMHFSKTCRVCHTPFTDGTGSREQGFANVRQPGTCPDCGSTVHYETKKASEWECADCGTKYRKPKRKED